MTKKAGVWRKSEGVKAIKRVGKKVNDLTVFV